MTSVERFWKAIALEKTDRVPVAPFIYYFAAAVAGIRIHDFVWDVDMRHQALVRTYERYGRQLDALHLHTFRFAFTSPFPSPYSALYFDWHFTKGSSGEIPQFVPGAHDESVYDRVLETGFASLIDPERIDLEDLEENERVAPRQRQWVDWWHEQDVVNLAGPMTTVPADIVMFARGMEGFIDVRARPEKLQEVNEAMTPGFIAWSKMAAEQTGARIQRISPQNFSTDLVSPKAFEALCWPWLRQMVLSFIEDGYVVLLHLDGRWEPLFEYLQDFPPGRILLELENCDMGAAKRALGSVVCLKGNVSPRLLAFGTSTEVEAACKRLVDLCAPGGGFILSSGCEVPFNAKPENVQTMIRVATEYGVY